MSLKGKVEAHANKLTKENQQNEKDQARNEIIRNGIELDDQGELRPAKRQRETRKGDKVMEKLIGILEKQGERRAEKDAGMMELIRAMMNHNESSESY